MTNKHKIFVYGTLRRGYGNNRLLEGQTFLGEAYTRDPNFAMVSNGWFPYVIRQATDYYHDQPNAIGHIWGELWEVDDEALARCDRLEGTPNHYQRHEWDFTQIVGEDHALRAVYHKAFMYSVAEKTYTRLPLVPTHHVESEGLSVYYDWNLVERK